MPDVTKVIRYIAASGNLMMAQARCMSFNGFRTEAAVTREALEAVETMNPRDEIPKQDSRNP